VQVAGHAAGRVDDDVAIGEDVVHDAEHLDLRRQLLGAGQRRGLPRGQRGRVARRGQPAGVRVVGELGPAGDEVGDLLVQGGRRVPAGEAFGQPLQRFAGVPGHHDGTELGRVE